VHRWVQLANLRVSTIYTQIFLRGSPARSSLQKARQLREIHSFIAPAISAHGIQKGFTVSRSGLDGSRPISSKLLSLRFDRGNLMTPSHARKGNTKYRYYLSSALFNGAAPDGAGSVRRVSATDIEALVIKSVREHLKPAQPIDDQSLVETYVARVEVQSNQVIIQLAQHERSDRKASAENSLRIAWRKAPTKRHREILLPEGNSQQIARPIRSETRARLVASIARGRQWLDELVTDITATTETIAKREGCSIRKVNMTISLAFLAPDLVKAAIDGRLPHGMGVARLADLPAAWSKQHQMLGLPAH
jgi:site-specific DNA recombinase